MLKVLTILSTVLSLVAVYTGVIALFTFKKRKPYPKAAPKTRFLVLIPARNEERVIAHLIDALRKQNYPRELFDIVVTANNCTDRTAEIARAAGVSVFECEGRITCKGDVLHQAIERFLPEKYDAFACAAIGPARLPGRLRLRSRCCSSIWPRSPCPRACARMSPPARA